MKDQLPQLGAKVWGISLPWQWKYPILARTYHHPSANNAPGSSTYTYTTAAAP